MTVKAFCDGCGSELTDANRCLGGTVPSRLGTQKQMAGGLLRVEIMVYKDGTANAGDWCKFCVLDTLQALDTRDRFA